MSHRTNVVKIKHELPQRSTPDLLKHPLKTIGAIDIHFHGAFGVDLMSAPSKKLNELSELLWKRGIAGFCPTTLSAPPKQLSETVSRLGKWIQSRSHPGAIPLGIHLEGPFISRQACGAHPVKSLRPLDLEELEHLWTVSQGTLKIITIAPDVLTSQKMKLLLRWSQPKGIVISLGHSRATEAQAKQAFDLGFQGVTHAWNALSFHQRQPGVLGAALGRPDTYLEIIVDQIHVAPTAIRWTLQIHPPQNVCFISDCLSAGGSSSSKASPWQQFGPLRIQFKEGACRLPNGHLAGGGRLLTQSYCLWVQDEARFQGVQASKILKQTLHHINLAPLRVLSIPPRAFVNRRVLWDLNSSGKICVIPVDSSLASG